MENFKLYLFFFFIIFELRRLILYIISTAGIGSRDRSSCHMFFLQICIVLTHFEFVNETFEAIKLKDFPFAK